MMQGCRRASSYVDESIAGARPSSLHLCTIPPHLLAVSTKHDVYLRAYCPGQQNERAISRRSRGLVRSTRPVPSGAAVGGTEAKRYFPGAAYSCVQEP